MSARKGNEIFMTCNKRSYITYENFEEKDATKSDK